MIEHIHRVALTTVTLRFALLEDSNNVLQEMGLDAEGVKEMLAFLRNRNKTDSLEALLDKPFEAKPQIAPKNPTRFSDGTNKVFYSALEPETAEAEVVGGYVKYAFGNGAVARTAYYRRFACKFQGEVKDLRPHLAEMPCLTHDDYADCNRIGVEAVHEGLDGLLSPSARKPEGTCLPVFTRKTLSDPLDKGYFGFKFDPSTGTVSVVAGQ